VKRGTAGRNSLSVYIGVCVFLLGSLEGCGKSEPPAAGSAPQQTEKPESAQRQEPPVIESGKTDSGPAEPAPIMKFEEANGFEIYERFCMVCHGATGEGDGFNAFNLEPRPRSLVDKRVGERLTDEELTRSISLGGAGRKQSPLMPGWGHTLNSRQIGYVIAYIRLLQRKALSGEGDSGDQIQASGAG
jgi:mono/diheme cytochrome c family protein